MAEARLAVAFQFAVTHDGVVVNYDKEVVKLVARSAYKSVKRKCNSAKNTILKGVYPASPVTWMLFLAAILAARYHEHERTVDVLTRMEEQFPGRHRLDRSTVIGLCILTVVTGLWLFTGYFSQLLLRWLLSNHALLYQSRGPLSFKTKLWVSIVKLLSGRNPGLFSFEKSIPNLPVPDLDGTLKRYLESVRPLLDDEQHTEMTQLAADFSGGIGLKLQRYIKLKSYWATNYVSDWWIRFVYLRSRTPLIVNSNYYGMGELFAPPTTIQTARAANIISSMFRFRKTLVKQTLPPIKQMGMYPLCSEQYRSIFGTTRIPHKEEDILVKHFYSTHVVVYSKGSYYKINTQFNGKLLKAVDIERQLIQIVEDSQGESCPSEERLAALTAQKRTEWADVRSKHFGSGVNKMSLDTIEKAAFVVYLDEEETLYDKADPSKLNKFSSSVLHGSGCNRWFDKSVSVVITKNGKIGINVEHSWADAPLLAHLWEWVMIEDCDTLGYEQDGHCRGKPEYPNWTCPQKLQWAFQDELVRVVDKAFSDAKEIIADVDLYVLIHDSFGKGLIKTFKVSPDAYIQLALQMAYYKDAKKCCLTYEAAMTRLFREGRTETVRSCTSESKSFVEAFVDTKPAKKELLRLFRVATNKHVDMYRKAMTGFGVDRHLFCLYVVSKYLDVEVPFLNKVLGEPWLLSTSQTPLGQSMRLDFNKHPERVTAGGGFGPVSDSGYGVSYVICGEDLISFHVSSCKSCSATSSEKFAKYIEESLAELRDLLS